MVQCTKRNSFVVHTYTCKCMSYIKHIYDIAVIYMYIHTYIYIHTQSIPTLQMINSITGLELKVLRITKMMVKSLVICSFFCSLCCDTHYKGSYWYSTHFSSQSRSVCLEMITFLCQSTCINVREFPVSLHQVRVYSLNTVFIAYFAQLNLLPDLLLN